MTEITAYSKYVRISPKKIRLLAEIIHGLSLTQALEQLPFLRKRGGEQLAKILKQALANAENNLKIAKETLRIKKIEIGKGPSLKRFRAVARGVAHQYKRRTSHIKVVLEEIEQGKGGGGKPPR